MKTSHVLLVEDSVEMQMVIRAALAKSCVLKAVATANDALLEIKSQNYALIILDVELPDESGFNLCAKIKTENKNAVVIFLTGKHQTSDKVTGFSLGADDYITKPIDPLEFRARIESKLRRIKDLSEQQDDFTRGVFRADLAQQKIFCQSTPDLEEKDLGLTSIEFKLFYYLLRHEEQTLSREQILNAIWGNNNHVTDRTVDTHICTLRKKIGSFASSIQSVPRMGYVFSQGKSTLARTA